MESIAYAIYDPGWGIPATVSRGILMHFTYEANTLERTRRYRCEECDHLEGHLADEVPINEWMCLCYCHRPRIVRPKKKDGKGK